MKISYDGMSWGGEKSDWYYFYWWNVLSKKYRYFGYSQFYMDGIHNSFGLWFINISWSTQWSRLKE